MRAQSEIERLIRQRVAEDPSAIWLKFKDSQYSWEEVLSFAQRAANGLLSLGIQPRDRVALMAGNSPEFLWMYFGAILIGADVVPLNRWQRGPALEHMLKDSGVVAIACDPDVLPFILDARPQAPGLRYLITINAGQSIDKSVDFSDLLGAPDAEPKVAVDRPVAAVGLLYTSGTTGQPKGIAAAKYEPLLTPLLTAMGVKAGETMYACLPLFHANALLISAIGSIRLNAKLALAERFSASQFWDDCRKFDAVQVNTLGAMTSILMKQVPRPDDRDNPVRTILSVGTPAAMWRGFETRFAVKILEWYGMSDAAGILLNTQGRVGSVGKPVGGAEFKVVDENGQSLPAGQCGELLFRHPAGQATSYHNLPDATRKAYEGGWFHSGDLGEQDDEGFFYFRGRAKLAIRRRGENISAWEVEAVLDACPEVLESAVIGVPSEVGEEEVMAVVVLQPGKCISPEDLIKFCEGKLAYYAVPRFVEFAASLPKTGTQKIQHSVLKERGRTEATWDREQAGVVVTRS
ncbi:AMP-binding protein [Pollutimonas bauzanensis]|uniref:Crotonobetaine/carnitine-CoA ligase n=1 Tax=Pollutimonas bauzanensis TaxID=658167 RepID=A0A1M5QLD5_9BURK|nr:AMP-binding protein [Pollutimonas bauzanensis]SHH14579.1 crotonobetaine/carnitine-CoA ligase [Pollutimonas bauzanensis]